MIVNTAAGKRLAADWTGTLENNAVVLTDVNEQAAAPGTAEKLKEVEEGLMAGTIKVYDTDTFTVNGQKLESYEADVHDAGDFVGETESIHDGQFEESVYRSAPTFAIDIDGITIIDG